MKSLSLFLVVLSVNVMAETECSFINSDKLNQANKITKVKDALNQTLQNNLVQIASGNTLIGVTVCSSTESNSYRVSSYNTNLHLLFKDKTKVTSASFEISSKDKSSLNNLSVKN